MRSAGWGLALSMLPCLIAATGLAEPSRVFDVRTDERTRATRMRAVSYLMSLSEEEMTAIVPRQSGIFFTDCPNCDTGAQDYVEWQWDPRQPHRIRCPGCGAVYPDNPDYPDDQYIAVPAPGGEHRYYYYERPDGYRIFFRAAADYKAADYMARRCRDLANLYWTTKQDEYARRAALILVRFAEVYPTWANKLDLPFRQKIFVPHSQKRIPGAPEYRTSCWSWWAYMGISRDLLEAWDAVRLWPGLDALAPDARARIENDLFTDMVELVMGFKETYSNMSPAMWRNIIYAGRVLDRPQWVAEALKRINHFWATRFLYDGHWMETAPSYCGQVRWNMKLTQQALEGYAPPASAPPGLGEFLRTSFKKSRAALAAVERANDIIHLPNGGDPAINDTWARRREPRERTESLLMPGLGLAVLGGGEGDHQIYSWLNFTSGRQHKHLDALDIGLFAFGKELLRDIGYTHTAWRAWTRSTMSHNTVVVNGVASGLDRDHSLHRLRAFVTDGKGFHLAEAESDAAYPGITTRYRRTLCLVGADSRDAYLIDIFQVHGGGRHDYLLHGSAAEDSTARIEGATLRRFDGTLMNPGTAFEYPKGERFGYDDPAAYYGYVRNLSRGEPGREVILDMRLSSDPEVGVRSHILCRPGDEVYLGEAPRIRQAERNDSMLSEFVAPFFCLRREGEELRSVFVAVHEPVRGEPKVRGISARELDGGLLVTVDRGERGRDQLVMGFDGTLSTACTTPDGGLGFQGKYALVRTRQGRPVSLHLVDGTSLAVGGAEFQGTPGWDGEIRALHREEGRDSRGWFEVAERIPSDATVGALLVRFADGTVRGYNVGRIEPVADGSRLHVIEDPGFEMGEGSVQLVTYPQREIEGATVTYHLIGAVSRVFTGG